MKAPAKRSMGDRIMDTATQERQGASASAAPENRKAVVPSNGVKASVTEQDQQKGKQKTIGEELAARGGQFKAALPAHIPLERFMRVVLTAVQRNPELAHADRASLFMSCMQAAQDGLLPDGKEGALVIYNCKVQIDGKDRWIKKVQWMVMVAGILKKVRNSGQLKTIVARVVYEGDKFRNWIDDNGEHIEYEAADDQNRDVIRRVFAMAKLKDDSIVVEVLQPADIEKIRNASKSKNNGPWVDWWDQMAQKSAIRRLSKRLPISTDLDDLIRRDDALYDFEGAREEARIANGGRQSLASQLEALSQIPADPRYDPTNGASKGQGDSENTEGGVADEDSTPARQDDADADVVDHDPDTGEIEDDRTPRELVIAKCTEELQKGGTWLRVRNMMAPEDMSLLTEEDKRKLADLAEFLKPAPKRHRMEPAHDR